VGELLNRAVGVDQEAPLVPQEISQLEPLFDRKVGGLPIDSGDVKNPVLVIEQTDNRIAEGFIEGGRNGQEFLDGVGDADADVGEGVFVREWRGLVVRPHLVIQVDRFGAVAIGLRSE
jgi:hypothetical protein